MNLRANWSYPTAIKFGAGRIAELAEQCKAVGMTRPLLVTDKALAAHARRVSSASPFPQSAARAPLNVSPAPVVSIAETGNVG